MNNDHAPGSSGRNDVTGFNDVFGKDKKKPVRTELAGSSSNKIALHTQLDV